MAKHAEENTQLIKSAEMKHVHELEENRQMLD